MDPYQELANAIVLQAVKDYRMTDDEQELREIETPSTASTAGFAPDTTAVAVARALPAVSSVAAKLDRKSVV